MQLPVFPEPQFKSHRPVLGLSDRTHPDTKNIRELIECRAVPRRMNCRSCVASWPRNCGSDPELLESAESQLTSFRKGKSIRRMIAEPIVEKAACLRAAAEKPPALGQTQGHRRIVLHRP